ncbi:nuclease-related domain-containing DEAD/DEAH box helicase [Acinetobacter sp. YH01003]|uniref:nuclease-related domain-containing DEAD/DEAH box helicase n=1 Tax=Acinetobacter sp. YH01003 TaxID=2601019 RepID=UPI0015D43F4B|nr:NERD domain-containing protein/DEAD/DEAH box helicase [Acinetobacter sp. YH01003]
MNKRLISPAKEAWNKLRQPLEAGEKKFIEYLDAHLPHGWEIYIQPHLNGLCPDIVILHPKIGIGLFEVKNWDFKKMEYGVEEFNNGKKHLYAINSLGEKISYVKKNPVDQLLLYRKEILDLYCPILSRLGYGVVVSCGLVLPSASEEDIKQLFLPIFESRNRKTFKLNEKDKHNSYVIFGRDNFNKGIVENFPSGISRYTSKYMNNIIAEQLRVWLREPESSKEQRELLNYNPQQLKFIKERTDSGFRRLKGPAGSGKSVVVAGRAATLLSENKSVLIVTFNITLLNYLQDLAVREYPHIRRDATWINFHYLCRRLCYAAGLDREYADVYIQAKQMAQERLKQDPNAKVSDFPDSAELCDVVRDAIKISEPEKYDAILVDEGQDFNPEWWEILKSLLAEGGEMLLCADTTQDIYASADLWTDDVMKNAGFRGAWAELKQTYRLPDNLIPLANKYAELFLPLEKVIKSESKNEPQGSLDFGIIEEAKLIWKNIAEINEATFLAEFKEFRSQVVHLALSNSDITILVQSHEIGMLVCQALDHLKLKYIDIFSKDPIESRQKKMFFFKGDLRIKVCTIHSFKGWEAKALLVVWDKVHQTKDHALFYTAITRLKTGKGSILYVANAEPSLVEYGKEWS